ncbi:MAG: xanthine dehydrogenase family protein molybdopterin-binding subunit, partial [Armatimonadetes bacterium]|nr:xanthine dehydrogenase family protein molybdopterin-binding subunit [Armatimonadota bacterium]
CVMVEPESETDRDEDKYAFHSFGAQFCKVRVDPELGTVRVLDWASVVDAGTILNPKTARNQIMGGVGFGIGMAMSEETAYDPRNGRPVNRNLADYHFAANADVSGVQVEFVNVADPHINRLGVRGIGEIGICGVPAAIANAIFNATGKRLRELPLTPDKVMG